MQREAGVKKDDLIKEIAALAVVGVAFASHPSAMTALSAAPSLLGLGRHILSRLSNDPKGITARAVKAVMYGIEQSSEASPELINEAWAALQAMPDATQLTQAQLVEVTKNGTELGGDLVELLMLEIPQWANLKARGLIETALSAGVRACTATEDFRTALSFELLQELSRDMVKVKDNTNATLDIVEKLHAGLEGMLRPEMNTLAGRFGHPDPEGAKLKDLKIFLQQKAEDLSRYKAQIEGIDDRTAELANIKVRAKDAVDRLEFDAVEMLLARVDQVETSISAETKELRAENFLLQSNVSAAFAHLSAAADSFQGIDPVEPARRRVEYADRLYQHGLRYSGPGFELASRMLQTALGQLSETKQPELWADVQNDLGRTLKGLGLHRTGAEGRALLAEAVSAYSAALRVWTISLYPARWAATQNNIGNALLNQGIRAEGKLQIQLLEGAEGTFRAVLEVRSKLGDAQAWARTQMNLANLLTTHAELVEGAQKISLLHKSVAALRAARCVFSKEPKSENWAIAQTNLSASLQKLGSSTEGQRGVSFLTKASIACSAALCVFTRDSYPMHWAKVKNNLGLVLQELGVRSSGPQGAKLIEEAIIANHEVLSVRTVDNDPMLWAMTQENIASAELALAEHDSCMDQRRPHLLAALVAVEAALDVFDPQYESYNHKKASKLQEDIRAKLTELGE